MASYDHHSSSSRREYQVFLSFSGEDTRKNFTGHLYNALNNKGIRTFRDKEELHVGENIGEKLLKAIRESEISIPIFSKRYASSKWCLKELAKIFECKVKNGQFILPIFLDVEPSEVRNQSGSFGEAFCKHEKNSQPEIIDEWRIALKEVGDLKGCVLKERGWDQSKLVQLVVTKVWDQLSNTPLIDAKHPVGLQSHVEHLLSLLNLQSTDAKFVGICGMGGIGKTTMAKAVYNEIFKRFDGNSFIADVRDQASSKQGLVCLQNQLLNDILKQNPNISHVSHGSKLIEEKLHEKEVLIILDDVDHRDQLDALGGNLNWFGPGSRLIITTRDEHVLKLKVDSDNIYKPKELDDDQSLRLFSMHAFQRLQPPIDYTDLSIEVVHYAGGLPLTLEVLGSSLYDVRKKEEWKSLLQKLEKVPHEEVYKKLKISYDGLDPTEKNIFLDIACFFIRYDKDYTIYFWEACDFYPDRGLQVLVRKSLVKIEEGNLLWMHDQLRDMGRQIVYEENTKKIEKRSRLWNHKDVMEVLEESKGTQNVEGILFSSRTKSPLRMKDLPTMSNLRILQIHDAIGFELNFGHLPRRLKWFEWRYCPLEIIPSNFYLEKVVILDLSHGDIIQAWNNGFQNKQFGNLKVLNLSHTNLGNSPNFSGFPHLERLILNGCSNLVDVHESIGLLKRLVHLDIKSCFKLIKLPCSVSTLPDESLQKLPSSIIYLHASNCWSLQRLPNLSNLKNLQELLLGKCHKLVEIQGLEGAESLRILDIQECKNLEYLPKLPSSIIYLFASGCESLERLPDLSNLKNLLELQLPGCKKLVEIQGLEGADSLKKLDMSGYNNLIDEFFLKLPSSIINIYVSGCVSLERPDLSNLKNLQKL